MDNVGSVKATFSHLDLSFDNTATGNPDHSILHIDNGGGKTTWLSLFFTLLNPRIDRFIQTIQKKNHKFEDYVKEQPGLILAEFVPLNEKDIATRILGQYVYKRGNDVKRYYFKMTGMRDSEHAFLSVPSIGRNSLHAIDDIHKFIRESGKCTESHSQADWMETIQEDLKMDESMINAQIDFCRSEGGISDFANFEKESDFMKTFFGMTMKDGQEIGEKDYRSLIYSVISEHQDLPNLRREVGILSNIKGSIKKFADQADQFNLAEEKYLELQNELGGYRTFLIDELEKLTVKQKQMTADEKESKGVFVKLKKEIVEAKTKLDIFDLLLAELEHATKTEEETGIQLKIKKLNFKRALLRAAEPYLDFKVASIEMQQKKKIVEESAQGSEAITRTIQDLWKHLAQILRGQISKHQDAINTLSSRRDQYLVTTKSHEETVVLLEIEHKSKIREEIEASAFIKSHGVEWQKLIAEGHIEEFGNLSNSIVTVENDRDQEGMKITDLESKIVDRTQAIKEKRLLEKRTNAQISELEKEKAEPFNFLKTAKNESSVMVAAIARFSKVNEEDVNIYDESDKRQIHQNLLESEGYAKRLERQIFEGEMELELIQSGDGTIVDADVAKVKEQLEELDIKTVYANNYLCTQLNDDIVKIAEVVKSDPARFLGLMVYQNEDILRIADVMSSLKGIRRPFVVSSLSVDVAGEATDHLVIEPSTPALYSKKKTAEYLIELQKNLTDLREKAGQARNHAQQAHTLLEKIDLFVSKYPEVSITENQQELERLEKKLETIIVQRDLLDSDIEKLEVMHDQNRTLLNECQKKESLLGLQLKALERFKIEFDCKLGEFKEKRRFCIERLSSIDDEIKDKKSDITILKRYVAECNETSNTEAAKLNLSRTEFNKTGIDEQELVNYNFKDELLELSSDQLKDQILSTEKEKEKVLAESGYQIAKAELDELQNKCANLKSRVQKSMDIISQEYSDIHEGLDLESLDIACKGLSHEDVSDRLKQSESKYTSLIKEQAKLEFFLGELDKKIKKIRSNGFDQGVYTDLSVYKTEGLLKGQRLEEEENHSKKIIEQRDVASTLETLKSNIANTKEYVSKYKSMFESLEHMYEDKGRSYQARYIDVEESAVLKNDLIRRNKALKTTRDNSHNEMNSTYISFKEEVNKDEIRKNPTYARIVNQTLQDMIDTYADTLTAIEELMKVHEHSLETADSDIKQAVSVLEGKVRYGLKKLKSAMSQRVPEGNEKYSGKLILKVHKNGERLFRMAQNEELGKYLTSYIEDCIEDNVNPIFMLTESIAHVVRTAGINQEGRLGIQILQIANNSYDYYRIDDIKSSGGERLTTALLLYIIIGSVSGTHGFSGGFLLTDNIFGTCNKASFVGVQLKVAQALQFQVVSTTGHHQKSFMSQYPNIISIIPSSKADESGNIINQDCVTKGVFNETRAVS